NFDQPGCGAADAFVLVQTLGGQYESSLDGVTYKQYPNTSYHLTPGDYTIYLRVPYAGYEDCVSSTMFTINQPPPTPAEPQATITDPTCDVTTGTIALIVQNPNDTYSFDGGATFQSSNVKSDMTSGAYNILIKNSDGCWSTKQFGMGSPLPVPSAPELNIDQPSCTKAT